MDDQPPTQARPSQNRQIALAVLAALVVLFCAVNLGEVQVNWVIGTWSTPLIVVIALSGLLGAGAGYLVARRADPGKAKG